MILPQDLPQPCPKCGMAVKHREQHYVSSVGHYTELEDAIRPYWTCEAWPFDGERPDTFKCEACGKDLGGGPLDHFTNEDREACPAHPWPQYEDQYEFDHTPEEVAD